jgi:bifunctional DNase/RNase
MPARRRYNGGAMVRAVTALVIALALARGAAARAVEVEVAGVGVDAASGNPVVRLVETARGGDAGARELPIWVGPFEAQAIVMEMRGMAPPRPLTHDLMKRLVERLGGKLTRVEVAELRDSTYIATVHLEGPGGKPVTVDARPSDAIALALRLHAPILVAEDLFRQPPPPTLAARVWGLTVQDMTPEVAPFFAVQGGGGVLSPTWTPPRRRARCVGATSSRGSTGTRWRRSASSRAARRRAAAKAASGSRSGAPASTST